LKTTECCCNL